MEFEGMAELQRRLTDMGSQAKRIENKAIRAGSAILLEQMQKEVPLSTEDHIHIRDDLKVGSISRKEGYPVATVGPTKETAWRAKFLEYGTVKMPPNPFISRAAEESRRSVAEVMKAEVRRGLGI